MDDFKYKFYIPKRGAGKNAYRLKCFLMELSELSRKYGIYVQGCGCCGSPWLYDDETEKNFDNLKYINDETGYLVDDIDQISLPAVGDPDAE